MKIFDIFNTRKGYREYGPVYSERQCICGKVNKAVEADGDRSKRENVL
jgi:hypothetical protein